jgi:hypothetical protein
MEIDFSTATYELLMPSYNGVGFTVLSTTGPNGTVYNELGRALFNIRGLQLTHVDDLVVGDLVEDGADWKIFDHDNHQIYLLRRT